MGLKWVFKIHIDAGLQGETFVVVLPHFIIVDALHTFKNEGA